MENETQFEEETLENMNQDEIYEDNENTQSEIHPLDHQPNLFLWGLELDLPL